MDTPSVLLTRGIPMTNVFGWIGDIGALRMALGSFRAAQPRGPRVQGVIGMSFGPKDEDDAEAPAADAN